MKITKILILLEAFFTSQNLEANAIPANVNMGNNIKIN